MTPAAMEMDTILKTMAGQGQAQWDRFDVARVGNCSVEHACYLIWEHQRTQRNRRPTSRPDMRFHRMAGYRTRSARYQTGEDIPDLRDIAHSLADDLLVKCQRNTDKDIRAILDSNPAATAAWNQQLALLNLQVQVTVQTLAAL
jgi:hypothetical protein